MGRRDAPTEPGPVAKSILTFLKLLAPVIGTVRSQAKAW